MLINDTESLEKEKDISMESSLKELNDLIQNIVNIKESIEKEIIKIDKLYDDINLELTNFFNEKHEILINKQNQLKEQLQNEVTKVKEKLENFLSDSNRYIKNGQNIQKWVKILENEEEKDIFKTLSYISKINQCNKEMKLFNSKLMRNLEISLVKEESNIKYEDYYFNGIQTPKDIEFKDINKNELNVFWNIDNINIINIDNDKIKYQVEIKKENGTESFKQVYEGNTLNCSIDNLKENTTYEIRICSLYNNLVSTWSQIQKIKTSKMNVNERQFIINPKSIRMRYLRNDYYLICQRYYTSEKLDKDNSKINIHIQSKQDGNKWIFEKDDNDLYSIIFDEDKDEMLNWRVFTDGTNVVLSRNYLSKFKVIKVEKDQNKFYIKDSVFGKYLFNSTVKRDKYSFFLGVSEEIDLNEQERYIFYFY